MGHVVENCRACDGQVEILLNLGHSPLANSLLTQPEDTGASYPLGLCACLSCGLVQNTTQLPTETLFDQNYPYLSSTSAIVRAHFDDLANAVAACVGPNSTALEIGSNDGTLQIALQTHGIACTGVDPASAAVDIATSRGCRSYNMAFDSASADVLRKELAPVDVAILCNVIAHVPDPRDTLRRAAALLKPSGWVVVEFQSWHALAQTGAFDMVYHEHHSHFSLDAFCTMAADCGLGVVRVDPINMQGGSLRVWCRPGRAHAASVQDALNAEHAASADVRHALVQGVDGFRASASAFADRFQGRVVAGYGAAAKTVTILSAAEGHLNPAFVADAAPTKVGKFLPLLQIPIVSVDALIERKPDVIILFAWNLADEILPNLQGFEVWSPIPQLRRIQ